MSRNTKRKIRQAATATATATGQPLAAQTVMVPCCFAAQPTAYALGFHHGNHKLRRRAPESWVYPLTRTAYVAGVMAGCAARALRLGLRPVE